MRLSLVEVLEATGGGVGRGTLHADAFGTYHTDSREVRPGGLFFALKGAEQDGHRFVPDALERGAAGVVVDHPVEASLGAAVIQVTDTWAALYALARYVLEQVSPLVVAITGSNGKTSTKELTAAVLGARHSVLKTEGNLNTETGVPITLLRLEPEHTAAVIEMGMQGRSEIERLAGLASPRIGVVTGIGTVHMEFFESQEDLARAKAELLAALPADGHAIVNADDRFADLLSRLSAAPVTTFGLEAGDLRGEGYRPLEDGSEMTVEGVRVRLALPGRHQARNALAALAAGRTVGIDLALGAQQLQQVRVEQRLHERAAPEGFTVVDDAYNASPESMLAAFQTLAERPGRGRLIALLGEMRELGSLSEAKHLEVGRAAAAAFDAVAVVDVGRGRELAAAAGAELVEPSDAAAWVRRTARPGDLVLVKASHGLALYEVAQELAP
jgi:UDP-N-acetylmuramoyl-tripeptide--D-alanyl-D-alanine ligase